MCYSTKSSKQTPACYLLEMSLTYVLKKQKQNVLMTRIVHLYPADDIPVYQQQINANLFIHSNIMHNVRKIF